MKKTIQQLFIMILVLSAVFIMMGLFLLTTPEHHKVLIKLFGEIVMLIICAVLIIYFTDRYVIPLNEKQRHKLIKILALLLPIFYNLGPIISKMVIFFAKTLIKYSLY